ncbi:tyrosine-type recombinase/integrase [Yoonia sp. GPGPB17]|uniref:tyrosine-type recombinase/integrase n=1 Tax=Yoonia sp. GPGPB17 TaxID=3026147 RepID=UPI0030BC1C7E
MLKLSEARELTLGAIQSEEQIISIRTLKKRDKHHVREMPVPQLLINELEKLPTTLPDKRLWPINRITAYRWIKAIMNEAGVVGPQASPKGLRHGYGIHATSCGIQIHLLKKWMGHTSIKTTAIYANAVGEEEKAIARRMW